VVISSSFPMRGFAQTLGVEWKEGPRSLEEPSVRRLTKTVWDAVQHHDMVYVHVQVESPDPVDRLCAMQRLDQLLLKPLTDQLPSLGEWRLLTAVDDRKHAGIVFVAMGTGVSQRPAAHLTREALLKSGLAFDRHAQLFSWFIQPNPRL
jgi:hypothetical protein